MIKTISLVSNPAEVQFTTMREDLEEGGSWNMQTKTGMKYTSYY